MAVRGVVWRTARRVGTTSVGAALVVLVVYVAAATLNSPGGYLGTDTGAKVITLDQMVEDETFRPAIGYWASEWDPEGEYHPLFDTKRNDDGEWVNVTTLPMLVASRPLYDIGGYRLALALPMLGALVAAFAARDLARQLSDERSGWRAFWVVSLASPVAVYALDFWEHSLGAGMMLAAIALLHRVVYGGGHAALAVPAGAAFGVSATMRAETFVVAFVAVGATCLVLLWRRVVARGLFVGALSVIGFAVPWLLNALLESTLGGNSRSDRVAREAQRDWWSELAERSEEALITWFALPGSSYPENVVIGALVVGAIASGIVLSRRGETRSAVLVLGAAVLLYLLSFSRGLSFVPGALVASPFAAAAFVSHRDRPRTFLLAVGLIATALTWAFQLTGGASPQWGGRYLLVPTLVLTILGVVALGERPGNQLPRNVVAGFAVAATVFGLVWLNHRSHGVDEFFDELATQSDDVVISTNGFLVREAGPAYDERRYLSVGRSGTVTGAVDVVDDAGLETFAVLTPAAELEPLSATLVSVQEMEFLGVPLWYHRYTLP